MTNARMPAWLRVCCAAVGALWAFVPGRFALFPAAWQAPPAPALGDRALFLALALPGLALLAAGVTGWVPRALAVPPNLRARDGAVLGAVSLAELAWGVASRVLEARVPAWAGVVVAVGLALPALAWRRWRQRTGTAPAAQPDQ